MVSAFMLTSCSDDDVNDEPVYEPVDVSNGLFVVNRGNYFNKIEGSLTYLDYSTNLAKQNVFQAANNRSLGASPNSGIIYGSKMYVAVSQSNVVDVIDVKSMKSLKQIKPVEGNGTEPRYLASHNGKVYVSMFDGYVAKIDTVSLAVESSVKVGDNPEEIAVAGDYLYVANSGYGKGETLSKIDLRSFTETKKINVGLNPSKIVANERYLFVICMGNYKDIKAMAKRVDVATEKVTDFAPATLAAIDGDDVYLINSPYGMDAKDYTYLKYSDDSPLNPEPFVSEGVDSPESVAVDPVTEHVFVGSFVMGAYGYADYSVNGYLKEYDEDGKFVRRYETGVDPYYIIFNTSVRWTLKD